MTSDTRAQRLLLLDVFEEGADVAGGHSVRHGIAAVLRHIAQTEYYIENRYHLPQHRLQGLADALTAPTLMERAMKGDATAARQFLREAGFTDERGQWLPQYQSISEDAND